MTNIGLTAQKAQLAKEILLGQGRQSQASHLHPVDHHARVCQIVAFSECPTVLNCTFLPLAYHGYLRYP